MMVSSLPGIMLLLLLLILLKVEAVKSTDDQDSTYGAEELCCPGWGYAALSSVRVPWGFPGRAFFTMPPGIVIDKSRIPGAGLGVISWKFIPRYTWLEEYDGDLVTEPSVYAWQVTHHGKLHHYVDARDVSTSNWLRFINCSRHRREENVMTCACKGRLYYISSRDIYPGRELLVYYGDDYAGYELDIDVVNYEKAGS